MIVASQHTADELMEDDRFELAGEMCRIFKVKENVQTGYPDEIVIDFYSLKEKPNPTMSLIVPKKTEFQIFNLQNEKVT